jgi:hypothetical protein
MRIGNFIIIVLVNLAVFDVLANDDTIVYGAAATKNGNQNVFVIEQPKNAPNPLGNPIPTPDKPVEVFGNVYNHNQNQTTQNQSGRNTQQQNLGNDFENTLLEANDRVYDVQSYPEADFKAMGNSANPQTIYSPNVND